jgi:hypothetical protein
VDWNPALGSSGKPLEELDARFLQAESTLLPAVAVAAIKSKK